MIATAPATVKSQTSGAEAEVRTPQRFAVRIRNWVTRVEAPSGPVLGVVALLTVLTWRLPAFAPGPRGENDYIAAITIARHLGLKFNGQLATTYGPLYFLATPSIIARPEVALAFIVWFVFVAGCLAACFQAFRRHLDSRWAWVACAAIAVDFSILPLSAVTTAPLGYTAILAIWYARGELPRWADRAFPVAMGLMHAAMLLTKFSLGLFCGPLVLGAVLARRGSRLRTLAEYATAAVLGLLGFWIAAGQPLLGITKYVITSFSMANGYAASLGMEMTDNAWEYPVAALLTISLAVGLARVKVSGWRWPLLAGLALSLWSLFRQGFVRHDSHSAQFFAVVFALCLLVAVLRRSAVMAVVAALTMVTQSASLSGGLGAIDPVSSVRSFAEGVTVVTSGAHRNAVQDASRQQLKQENALPDRFVTEIGKQSVKADPFDFTMAWTYGLTQTVEPTVLNYQAYTELLDTTNAKWLANDATGPAFIVRENARVTLDYRFPLWDPPRTQLEEACRYHLVDSSDRWQLLRRGPDRCGPQRDLATMTLSAGQSVDVPQVTNGILIARVYPEQSIASRLQALLFKPPGDLWISVDGERHRLPWTHAGAPLMIAAPNNQGLVLQGRELSARKLSMNAPGRVVFSVVPTS